MRKQKGFENVFETFQSVEQFFATIESRKVCKTFDGKELASQRDGTRGGFYRTESYAKATELLMQGDSGVFEKLKTGLENMQVFGREVSRRVHAVNGFGVNVGRALTGSAKCMIARKKQEMDGQILDVVICASVDWTKTSEQINEALCKMFSVINQLEKNDVQTNIYIYYGQEYKGQKIEVKIKVKDAGTPFNLLKYSYPCANTDMYRRHFFKYLENSPENLHEGYVGTYGCPISTYDCRLHGHEENVYVFNMRKEIENPIGIERIYKDVEKALEM